MRSAIDGGVDLGIVGGGDDDEVAVEVGGFEGALNPFELAFVGELADFLARMGRDDAEMHAGLEQAADFVEGNSARADQEAAAAIEFEEDGQQVHGSIPSGA